MPRHGWQVLSLQRGGPFSSGADFHGPNDVSAFEQRINSKAFRLVLYSVLYGLVCVIIVLENLSSPSASDISRLRINMTSAQLLQARLGYPGSINRQVWVYLKAHGWLILGFWHGRLTEIHDQQTGQ